jgi:hypothetical protein
MTKQVINVSTPNDGLGDSLRTAFVKTNDNFTELYSSGSTIVAIGNDEEVLFRSTGSTYNYNTTNTVYIDGGEFYANVKHFRIDHPQNEDMLLIYTSLESPYNGIRLTGKDITNGKITRIKLPDYISKLIHDDDINIQITTFRTNKKIWVYDISIPENYFEVKTETFLNKGQNREFFWSLTGVRKDIEKLQVETFKK